MKIYVAGKNLKRAERVMADLRDAGQVITYDWVALIDDTSDMVKKAFEEREAIIACDALVYLWEPDQESARYEAGMAMGLDKPIIISGKQSAHFFTLPNVRVVASDSDIVESLPPAGPPGA